jgi:alpha-tubulin suppressor-like RCC1 family protein
MMATPLGSQSPARLISVRLSQKDVPKIAMEKLNGKCLAVFRLVFLMSLMAAVSSANAGNKVIAWGAGTVNDPSDGYDFGQSIVPANLTNAVQLAGGRWHSLALKANGTLQGWGDDDSGQIDCPSGSNFVAIACGSIHSLALESNGLVAAFGDDIYGELEVPESLSNVVAIACGFYHSLALQSDGAVVAWGAGEDSTSIGVVPNYGQSIVPVGLSNVVAIAAGGYHSLALKSNGTLTEWGDQTNIPLGLSNVVAIATGAESNIALTTDGTLIVWGTSTYGEANVPAALSNVLAITDGSWHTLALTKSGTVVAWGAGTGDNTYVDFGQNVVPTGLSNIVQVAAGWYHSLALDGSHPPTVEVSLAVNSFRTNDFNISSPSSNGRVYQFEYANSLTDPIWTALPLQFGNGGALELNDPSAANATQRFYRLNRW